MSAPPSPTHEPPPVAPVELPGVDLDRLRAAAGWARLIAVVGFAFTALAVALLALRGRPAIATPTFVPFLIAAAATTTGAILMAGYGKNVHSFFREGEPSLTLAFRRLRFFLGLWTSFVLYDTATTIIAVLKRL
jgi:hypothetical protein